MGSRNWTLAVTLGLAALLYGAPSPSPAATPPSLGNAGSFAVLAGSEVTNTGLTSINGDVGISPGIGPLPHYHDNGTVTFIGGAVHDADLAAQNAQADKNAAYGALDQTCDFSFAGTKELAGLSLVPGVYCATSFHLTAGTLTLIGVSSDTWIFKSASDLIMTGGAAAKVVSPSCSVWWRVVSSATFDAGSSLVGNILADTSITLAAGASLTGKALARTAEVTLSSNTITGCSFIALTPTVTGTPPTATPTVTGTPPTATRTPTPVPTSTSGPSPTQTPAVAVPTVSGGAMIVLAGLLALVAFAVIRRAI
jgi:Ice-binding-like